MKPQTVPGFGLEPIAAAHPSLGRGPKLAPARPGKGSPVDIGDLNPSRPRVESAPSWQSMSPGFTAAPQGLGLEASPRPYRRGGPKDLQRQREVDDPFRVRRVFHSATLPPKEEEPESNRYTLSGSGFSCSPPRHSLQRS